MAAFQADPAFIGAGKAAGLTLWRIENKQVVKQDAADGKFHEGDCYILLATTETPGRLDQAVHFWLGSECSQDEMGVAAYKTVELDDALGGTAVQYRETQGRESPLFMSYFKQSGVEYLPGGVESGFNTMEKDVFRTRLLHAKGKRTVRISEVPRSSSSLNTGDVFILDAGLQLYLWNGPEANMYEKSKGALAMQRIKDTDRAGRATMIFLDNDPENAEFWDALGGYEEITAEGEPDEAVERVGADAVKLYRVSDESGDMSTEEISPLNGGGFTAELLESGDTSTEELLPLNGRGSLTAELSESGDVYILDVGSEVFVWVGRGSSVEEKKSGVPYAVKFVEESGRDTGGYFQTWNPSPVPTWEETPSSAKSPGLASPPPPLSRADSAALVKGMHTASEAVDAPVDDGSGDLQIWRVENFKLVEWPKEKYGQFYGGDCYVMLYTYFIGDKENYLIYFWQGRESSQDEIGSSALLAKSMDDDLDDAAVQVPEMASSLNSGDSFVLLTPTDLYVWVGGGCASEEAAVAEEISEMLLEHGDVAGRSVSIVPEGSEPDEFWAALGGEAEYPKVSEGEVVPQEPRLFQVSNATGKLTVTPVCNFDQSDLCVDDIMLLDTVASVFVWVGPQANLVERTELYIDTASDGRSPDTPLVQVAPGHEPPMFTQHFRGWDPLLTSKTTFVDPYQAKLEAAKAEEAKLDAAKEEAKKEAEFAKAPGTTTMEDLPPPRTNGAAAPGGGGGGAASRDVPPVTFTGDTIPYADLKGYGKEIDGVDPLCREQYLSEKEFADVFGMSKASFATQPKWKQVSAKKSKELF
eukprot:jgi/Undpi1/3924/HiC_scaffold_16.g07292.m1